MDPDSGLQTHYTQPLNEIYILPQGASLMTPRERLADAREYLDETLERVDKNDLRSALLCVIAAVEALVPEPAEPGPAWEQPAALTPEPEDSQNE